MNICRFLITKDNYCDPAFRTGLPINCEKIFYELNLQASYKVVQFSNTVNASLSKMYLTSTRLLMKAYIIHYYVTNGTSRTIFNTIGLHEM